jgi:hypothetical protein
MGTKMLTPDQMNRAYEIAEATLTPVLAVIVFAESMVSLDMGPDADAALDAAYDTLTGVPDDQVGYRGKRRSNG